MNTYSTSKLFTHKPVIEYTIGTTDQKYEPVLTVHKDKVFYFGKNGLFSLNYDSEDWKTEATPPFKVKYGYTMTSTPAGLVIFGGSTGNDKIISDIWIYSLDRWRALAHNTSPRCFHASTWIPGLDALLISGGYNKEGFLSDFLLLDLKSEYTREFPLQYPLPFAYHTVTVITDNILCLYGGKCSDGSQNNKIFLININDGSVREINVVPFFDPRYLHRAFNFYGNLLVTGGYSDSNSFYLMSNKQSSSQISRTNPLNPSFAKMPILFVFLHRVWLSFDLPDSILSLIPDVGFILPLSKGLMIISSKGDQSAVLYLNESREPFSGTKDAHYITFLNNLLHQNLNSLNSNPENSPVEKRRKNLLDERRKIYSQISNKLGVEDISIFINERDHLNRLLSKVQTNLHSIQPNPESFAKSTSSITQHNEFNYSDLKQDALNSLIQYNTNKSQQKEIISRTSKTVKALFEEVQLLMNQKNLSVKISSKPLFDPYEQFTNIFQKVSLRNLSVVNEEIERTKYQYKSIVEQMNIYNKMKSDYKKDMINIYEKIDALMSERHKKKQKLVELQKKYLENAEEMLSKMSEICKISESTKNNEEIKKETKSIFANYDEFKSIKVEHRNFIMQMRDQIAQFKHKAEKLQIVSNYKSKEQLLTQAIQTAEALSAISNTFNKFSKKFTSPEEKLNLPDIKIPEPEKKNLPEDFHILTNDMRHGRRLSALSEAPKEDFLQDQSLWNPFYEIIDNAFTNADSLETK